MWLYIEQLWNLKKIDLWRSKLILFYLHYLFLNQVLEYILDVRVMHEWMDTRGVSIPQEEIVYYYFD